MNAINIGVIGCGKVAEEFHFPSYKLMDNVEIKAVCDTKKSRATKIASKYKVSKIYTDYVDLLENEDIDVVDICTPGFTHYQICKEAIERRINTIVEKPPTLSLEEAIEIKNLSKKNNVSVGVMMNYRYKDIILKLKKHIEEGKIGKIKKIHTISHGQTVFNLSEWLWDEKKSYYLIYELGIHPIDLQVYLLGKYDKILFMNVSYNKKLKTTTDLQLVIRYKNNALGFIEITQDTTLHSSFFTSMNVYGTGSDAFLQIFPPSVKFISGIHNPLDNVYNELRNALFLGSKLLRKKFQLYRTESYKKVLEMFVESVSANEQFPISIANVISTMRLLEEIKQNIPSYQQCFEVENNEQDMEDLLRSSD